MSERLCEGVRPWVVGTEPIGDTGARREHLPRLRERSHLSQSVSGQEDVARLFLAGKPLRRPWLNLYDAAVIVLFLASLGAVLTCLLRIG